MFKLRRVPHGGRSGLAHGSEKKLPSLFFYSNHRKTKAVLAIIMKMSPMEQYFFKNRDQCFHNKAMHSLLSVFIFLLQLSCPAYLSFDVIVFPPPSFPASSVVLCLLCRKPTSTLHTHTSSRPPRASHENATLLLCSQPAPATLESKHQADSRQSLTRLFSAAAAVTADDPLDLFCGILMRFDMLRGPCRSHNTCLNTRSLWLSGAHSACWI